jgi:enoyl-CoA hydratase/carnithine racemase
MGEGLEYVAQRNAAMLLSKDLEEAISAFLEKRASRFED